VKTVSTFFEAPETQLSAFFVYRLYIAAFGRPPRFSEFLGDRNSLTSFCHNDWSDIVQIVAGQRAFLDEWVRRRSFLEKYPERAPASQFVARLFDSAALPATDERKRQLDELTQARKGVKCCER